MKRIAYILLMLSVSTLSFAQNKTDRNGRKQGHWVKYYDNGAKMYEGDFVNGQPVGEFVRYYDNGKRKMKQVFDAKTGNVYTEFYKTNGTLLQKGVFKNEKRTGEWTTYSQKGEILQVDNYADNGLLNGTSTVYDAQGRIFETTEWKNGKKDGMHKQFFPNGQVQSEVNYRDGLRDGTCISYFDDGKTETTGQYSNDRKEGVWTVYDRDGETILAQTEYKAGISEKQQQEDAMVQEEVKQNDENAGKLKDPADFRTSPEEYFTNDYIEQTQAPKKKEKKKK